MTSTSIVLPALDQWAEGKITALYQATTQDDFNTAFDDFIAKDVHIYVNGAKMTRDQYKQLLEQQRILESSATVKFDGVVRTQLPDTEFTQDSGLVGLFFTATIFERIRIRDAQVAHTITSSLNISVNQDGSIPIPIIGPTDRRRVMTLNQVFMSQSGTGVSSTTTA